MASRTTPNNQETKFIEESPAQAEAVEEPVKETEDEDIRAKAERILGDDFEIHEVKSFGSTVNVRSTHKDDNVPVIHSFTI